MPFVVEELVESRSLSDRVHDLLRKQIVQGNPQPGERLDIPKLARDLGVSRTPVKDAINRLACRPGEAKS